MSFVPIPQPKGYHIKLCNDCKHNYSGPDCDKCWNLRSEANGDYWVDKLDHPFPIKTPTETEILEMRTEHLEGEVTLLKEELTKALSRFAHHCEHNGNGTLFPKKQRYSYIGGKDCANIKN